MTTQTPTLGPDLTVKGLNVYAGPGNSYDRIKVGGQAVYIEGGSHAILGKDADSATWYQIRVENTMATGWIRAAHVQTQGNLGSLSVDQTLPRLSRAANAPARLNAYAGPGTNHSWIKVEGRLFFIDDNSKYLIEGKDANTPAWYRIRVNDTATGWINATQVQTHGDLSRLPLAWLPPLPAKSLELPVWKTDDAGKRTGYHPISSLFSAPRRWWRPQVGVPLRHEGIDWACSRETPVRAMIGGTVTSIYNTAQEPGENSTEDEKKAAKEANFGYGNAVTVESELEGRSFELTYAHLSTVTVKRNDEVRQGQRLGTSGNTGNSTGPHLHVHYIPDSQVNRLDFFRYQNYQDFHAALPSGLYHWPDTTDLQADIDAARKVTRDRLIPEFVQWMDNALLKGTSDPHLRVKRGGKAYMIPQADAKFEYPCRPLVGHAIVGMDKMVSDLRRSDTGADLTPDWWRTAEAVPTPDWWKIKVPQVVGKPYFPICWVRREDAEVIGDRRQVSVDLSSLSADLPRYLKKDNGTNVRCDPRTDKIQNGQPVPEDPISPRPIIAGWVPIVDLACDEITGDYL